MSDRENPNNSGGRESARDIVAQVDTGRRKPDGHAGRVLTFTALAWSLFQLWYASPLPFMFDVGVFNNAQARSIHLAFALLLAYTAFPALKSSPLGKVPPQDWVLGVVAATCGLYLFLFYRELSQRPGAPILQDIVVACIGIVLLLEATRRAIGLPLAVVAVVLLSYTYFGPYMPSVIAHKGASLAAIVNHQWITTEGVYGVALGVSTDFVFLFVLFGALLEQAGAGQYFIKVAFALLGHMRGGPAKAAVVASGMTGMISGSSIANVVTTGTFTIPLMKRVGFPDVKAGAIEVAASTNGQLMPPIMGAAAFLMVEYVGIPYLEVIKHAFLPAVISYIGLIYIVHLEAVKAGMKGLPRATSSTFVRRGLSFVAVGLGVIILSGAVYYGLGWMKDVFGAAASWIAAGILAIVYVALLWYAARFPEFELEDPESGELRLPPAGETIKSGLQYLLPVVVLVWCLTVERFSPGLSAFWATVFMMLILVTQRPALAFFRNERRLRAATFQGFFELFTGLVTGARNMVGIGVATAAAGIVVGTVTQTGIGLVMTEFVEAVSGGNLVLVLLFTALICVVLGLGLPTTANYIVVSALMAPVILALATKAGLAVPLIAVHLFVFYFGILADDTPPVGLAAFAAAAISRADPIRTGVQGFAYDIRTAVLPFMFIFNTELLLIGITSIAHLFLVITVSVVAMLCFAAGTQGFWLTRTRLWESAGLLLVAFTLFRPGFWWDMIYPPIRQLQAEKIVEVAEGLPAGASLRLTASGQDISGNLVTKTVSLPMGPAATGHERLEHGGIVIREEDGKILIDQVLFASEAEKNGLDWDWEITALEIKADVPPSDLMFLPAAVLLGVLFLLQRRRRARQASAPAA
ncbi:MAG TPA: TRAP transporter permease [Gammaproteobacteria bacterium]|nr:TRAP transporter permease [Gammaproteobacteria bacterium]